MKRHVAEMITRDPEKFAHHDRVFKNNPVVMQGMGLAPLVVLATSGRNAVMLAVAVALLLTPSRMLACLLSRLCPLRDERPAPEELEKKLLPRAFVYSGSAAVVLTISSKLSGTYQSACIAAADYDNVYVVDSGTAAIGTGILAEYALTCIDRGMDAAALARELTEKREDVCVLALVDTLEYLKRGGRISKTTALAGGLLNIKPVLTIEKGEILLIGKARGSRQGNNLLVEKIRACGGIDFSLPILLGYTGLSDALLQKYVADSAALWRDHCGSLEQTLLCSVIGTHTGPGVVAVAFFKNGV